MFNSIELNQFIQKFCEIRFFLILYQKVENL